MTLQGPRASLHTQRQELLSDLAVLAGFSRKIQRLPDGCEPDVLRTTAQGRALFMGDAKDTETPGNRATQARLLRYFKWASIYLRRTGDLVLIAVCFGSSRQAVEWISTLQTIAREVSMPAPCCSYEIFAPRCHVVLLRF